MNSNDEIVEYCLFCGSLHLIENEEGTNIYCANCGSENFVGICKDINEYLEKKESDSLTIWKKKK